MLSPVSETHGFQGNTVSLWRLEHRLHHLFSQHRFWSSPALCLPGINSTAHLLNILRARRRVILTLQSNCSESATHSVHQIQNHSSNRPSVNVPMSSSPPVSIRDGSCWTLLSNSERASFLATGCAFTRPGLGPAWTRCQSFNMMFYDVLKYAIVSIT